MENIFFAWTGPNADWLIGIGYEPDNVVTDLQTNEESEVSILTLGFLFFRIDILI